MALGAVGCGGDAFAPPAGFVPPPPGTVVDLAPGEVVTFEGAAAVTPLDLPAAAETRSYVVAVQNASTLPGAPVPVRVTVRRLTTLSAGIAPAASRRAAPARPERRDPFDRWFEGGEVRFRAAAQRALAQAGARPAAPRGRHAPGARASISGTRVAAAPTPGDTITFVSAVDIDGNLATCSSTVDISGVVRAVGPTFALVEDVDVAGHLTAADYAAFLDEMENVVRPVSSAYFGTPHDVDGNGIVFALVSAAVNRLGAAGFFTPTDLASAQDCPASNQAEILWLVGPDPTGEVGEPIPVDIVRDRLVGIVAHELQHLVHAERRAFEAGGDLASADVPWINEGLSHIAEEVAGLYAGGLRTGDNLDFSDLGDARVSVRFRRYHLSNFRFMRDYFQSTADVPAIVDGAVTRLALRQARGFGYLFLRWVADQFAASGPPGLVASEQEEALFRSLTVGGGGLFRSTATIESALASTLGIQRPWRELFAQYAPAPAVDDQAVESVPLAATLRLASWNLPAAYVNAGVHGFSLDFPNGFPLRPQLVLPSTLPEAGFQSEARLLPSTAVYFRLESSRTTPLTQIRLVDAAGSALADDAGIQVTIVRTF